MRQDLRRPLRCLVIAPLLAVLLGAVALLIPPVRAFALERAGTALVAEDPLAAADVIAIGPDIAEDGALEAADLVQRVVARRVIVLAGPLDTIDQEIARRGVPYDDSRRQLVHLLGRLGVEQAELLRLSLDGTQGVARLFPEWCAEQKVRSVVLVTGADHSRRFRRVLRRNPHGSTVQIRIRVSRYSPFTPDRWWHDRASLRAGIVELEKLLLDVARHPFS